MSVPRVTAFMQSRHMALHEHRAGTKKGPAALGIFGGAVMWGMSGSCMWGDSAAVCLCLAADNEHPWRAMALKRLQSSYVLKVMGKFAEGSLWEKQVDILGRKKSLFAAPYSSSG